MNRPSLRGAFALLLGLVTPSSELRAEQEPLRVCATTADLGSLVRQIGGDQVTLTVFAKPTEDAHFVEAKPSYVKSLHDADLLVLTGLELEVGYLPVLIRNARNERVVRSAPGYVDASAVIEPREVPTGTIDRSQGDVHPFGNPHYLTDPLNGLRVAALLRDKLGEVRPARE